MDMSAQTTAEASERVERAVSLPGITDHRDHSHHLDSTRNQSQDSSRDHELSDAQRCYQVMAHNSKSFTFASQMFSRETRAEVAVLYAWCRRADDAVDEVPRAEAGEALIRLREELDAVYAPLISPLVEDDLVLRAFRALVLKREIPKYYPCELLEGMQMDVEGFHYRSLDELRLYCYRVASVVGLMMCHVMGVRRESALLNAAHLGLAMQLTNISRDVGEDWGLGRQYLPHELMRAQCAPDDILKSPPADGLVGVAEVGHFKRHMLPEVNRKAARSVTRRLLAEADRSYQMGYKGVSALPLRAALAIRSAGMIYQAIGGVIERADCDPHQPRAVTSRWTKCRLLTRAVARELTSRAWSRVRSALTSFKSRESSLQTLFTPQRELRFEALLSDLNERSAQHPAQHPTPHSTQCSTVSHDSSREVGV